MEPGLTVRQKPFYLAAIGGDEKLHQARFACAIGPQQKKHLPKLHLDGEGVMVDAGNGNL